MGGNQTLRLTALLLIGYAASLVWPTMVFVLKVAAVIGLSVLVIWVVGSLVKKEPADSDTSGASVPFGAEGSAIMIGAIALLSVVAVLLLAALVLS